MSFSVGDTVLIRGKYGTQTNSPIVGDATIITEEDSHISGSVSVGDEVLVIGDHAIKSGVNINRCDPVKDKWYTMITGRGYINLLISRSSVYYIQRRDLNLKRLSEVKVPDSVQVGSWWNISTDISADEEEIHFFERGTTTATDRVMNYSSKSIVRTGTGLPLPHKHVSWYLPFSGYSDYIFIEDTDGVTSIFDATDFSTVKTCNWGGGYSGQIIPHSSDMAIRVDIIAAPHKIIESSITDCSGSTEILDLVAPTWRGHIVINSDATELYYLDNSDASYTDCDVPITIVKYERGNNTPIWTKDFYMNKVYPE